MLKRIRLIIGLCFVLCVSKSYAALEIVITEGIDTARPIGIVPFKWNGSGVLPGRLEEVISADLRRSGKFKPVPVGSMPQYPANDSEVDYSAWAGAGVDVILVGSVQQHALNRYLISFELIDVVRGQITGGRSQILSNGRLVDSDDHIVEASQSIVDGDNFRQHAHRISDIVFEKLTGIKGAFLTRILSSH